jgi:hypothetical protein
VGLFFGLLAGLGSGLFFGLFLGKAFESRKHLSKHSMLSQNEGIRRSGKNALFVMLVVGLCLGLGFGLAGGIVVGLFMGLFAGLGTIVKHYTLRFWFWRTQHFPWNVVPFLNDAVEKLLLRKVGGGYIFRHGLLKDYFASLDTSISGETQTALASLQKSDEKE